MAGRREPAKPERKVRSYKNEMPPSVALRANESFEGTFQHAEQVEITDKTTKESKDVWVYTFMVDGKKMAILGRWQLDKTFQEVFEREGGMEHCQGLNMRIERGPDSKIAGGRTLGNYEISVWEAE